VATASVTSQGRLNIPIEVAGKLRFHASDPIAFIEREEGEFTVRVKKGHLMDLCGWLKCGWHKWTANPVTLEEMDLADCQASGAGRRPYCA
jgi:bifunctional DNA-binding transcriptional regulator/antitoxin component of YhaV-PrlF toxin-antitoxin module